MYWSYSFDYDWLISPDSEWLKSPDANIYKFTQFIQLIIIHLINHRPSYV